MTPTQALKKYFGYNTFRKGQETLINDILTGRDALGIMPTGAGKSMCFQIPALINDGIVIVISPLISLMKDQVNALTQSGIPAAFINSSLTERQIHKALANAQNGAYKLIYTAPERLANSDFLHFAANANITMVTVDEAHCISQWGQDFRPSYSEIPVFISQLKNRPVVSAFTATATPLVKDDIVSQLALLNPSVLVSGFDRPNLFFDIKAPKDKFSALLSFLKKKKNQSGIVYCSTRANVEDVCEGLIKKGYNASRYHAGLSDNERHSNQDDFLFDRVQIMVATNAFGMGIDKSNVSFVIHYNMPKDVEGYYQEAGRAGRDGEPAECLILYSKGDVSTNMWMINNNQNVEYINQKTEDAIKERNIKRLQEMDLYCTTKDCLREYILKYFGETPPENCSGCTNCETEFEEINITEETQKIISCVARMKERFGVNMVIDVLRGRGNSKVLGFGLDKLTTFGISTKSAAQLGEIINHLLLTGYLQKTVEKYPIVKLTPMSKEALAADANIIMKITQKKTNHEVETKRSKTTQLMPLNTDLLAVLKERRLAIATKQSVPAFVIFHDSTLTDMCMKKPTTIDELMDVSGIGSVKAERYGQEFLDVIKHFLNNDTTPTTPQEPQLLKKFDPSAIEISDEPISVSVMADKINCHLMECGHDKVASKKINDWLVFKDYMYIIQTGTRTRKQPTESGTKLGITSEDKIYRGEKTQMNYYASTAQKYVAENTMEILKFKPEKPEKRKD